VQATGAGFLASAAASAALLAIAFVHELQRSPPPSHPVFTQSRPPLTGSATESLERSIEIRGFVSGRCELPPEGAKLIAEEAAKAAAIARPSRQLRIAATGGADGSPIENLASGCAALVARQRGDRNHRLAQSRAAGAQKLFMNEFEKAGGKRERIQWIDNPPRITRNINQPHDRSAVVTMVWHAAPTETASQPKRKD
jgi:hypothetical protein